MVMKFVSDLMRQRLYLLNTHLRHVVCAERGKSIIVESVVKSIKCRITVNTSEYTEAMEKSEF